LTEAGGMVLNWNCEGNLNHIVCYVTNLYKENTKKGRNDLEADLTEDKMTHLRDHQTEFHNVNDWQLQGYLFRSRVK
jgi:hypothetical protein